MKLFATVSLAIVVLAGTGCNEFSERWQLDHARVLALRLSPPALDANESATIDALVVDDARSLREVSPTAVTNDQLGLDPAVAGAITITDEGGTWTVIAGDADAIAAARAALMLAADEPLDVPFGSLVDIDGTQKLVLKTVRLGRQGSNPAAPTIVVDGTVQDPAIVGRDRDIMLSLGGVPDDPADPATADDQDLLEFAWMSATGDLTESLTREATMNVTPDEDVTRGPLVVVIRNALGGVTWADIEIQVE